MSGLLADANLDGHFQVLRKLVVEDEVLDGLRADLKLTIATFRDLGWAPEMPDDELWRRCQSGGWILVTANRNHKGPTSLEATIRREGTAESLPIVTISDADRFLKSGDYARRVAYRLLEYALEKEARRGSGRLFAP